MSNEKIEAFQGQQGSRLLTWLMEDWVPNGPNVCIIEGFSGVGKTELARTILQELGDSRRKAVMIVTPESESTLLDDLLLDLAEELDLKGVTRLVDALDRGEPLIYALQQVLLQPILIIVDEFQRAFEAGTARPPSLLMGLLEKLSRREQQGRLLFLTNRSVERARWSEPIEKRTLHALEQDEAERLLARLLEKENRSADVAVERRPDIVAALGRNPRAIHVLVQSLRWTSLDDLIGEDPELWENLDRAISPDLLRKLEVTSSRKTGPF